MREQTAHVQVNSGATVSGVAAIIGAEFVGFVLPTSIGAQVFAQAATDTLSASFARLQAETNSVGAMSINGDWTVTSGNAARAISLGELVKPFPYLRFELSAAATLTHSIAVVAKY